ncbi:MULTISPECIES: Crp/Fnr family transcriptional regulator [Spirulina sp. CCY15215]|uniref:Crp/Fnr family transcriptional regulator n=1 Tax=Spirulina sp. CCY15215 TaxID=2767591 RepID=UPI0019515558|nr:Crp/Fnr family transcriptional regulator [Spirulina major]
MLLTPQPIDLLSQEESPENRRLHLYHRGENIPLDEGGVWQVYRGLVQVSTAHASGEEVILGWATPATFFGLWLTRLEFYEAKALSDVYLRWFPLQEIENSPFLTQTVSDSVTRRLRQTEAILAIAGYRRVEDRLTRLLSLLDADLGQVTEAGSRLQVRFTHQNLANAIGTTRVTVTRLLGKLQRSGCIQIDRDRHIIIQNS